MMKLTLLALIAVAAVGAADSCFNGAVRQCGATCANCAANDFSVNPAGTGACAADLDGTNGIATQIQCNQFKDCKSCQALQAEKKKQLIADGKTDKEAQAKVDEDQAALKKMSEDSAKTLQFCPTDKAKCVDSDASWCPVWEKDKQCYANPDWMLVNCAKSCCPVCTGKNNLGLTQCPGDDRKDLCAKNNDKSCAAWQKAGECPKNAKYMIPNCMTSCCKSCWFDKDGCPNEKSRCATLLGATGTDKEKKDGIAKCDAWAKLGECTVNPKYMLKNCAKQCCPVCASAAPAKTPATTTATLALPVQQFANFNQFPQFGGYQQQRLVGSQQPLGGNLNLGGNLGGGLAQNYGLPYYG